MKRREFAVHIFVNHVRITNVVIDPHYEEKHAASISDEIILELVKTLDGQVFVPDDIAPPFAYFRTEGIELRGRRYRLIWLLEKDQIYIGVVNAYRR